MPLEERKTIGMEALREHVRIILRSGNVENERPLSTLIIAHPERSKTTETLKLNSAGALVFNDVTAWGIQAELAKLGHIERNLFHHLIIPDMERISARGRTVRRELVSTLQILMQEGLTRIRTHETDLKLDPPMQLGVIMCTTPDDMKEARLFRRLSFLSRLIPFSYEFAGVQRSAIMEFIENEDHLKRERMDITDIGKSKVTIPQALIKRVRFYSSLMTLNIEDYSNLKWERVSGKWQRKKVFGPRKLIGIRSKEEVLCYLKAIALDNRRNVVTEEDFEEFEMLFRHFNFDMNELEFVT